MKRHFVKVTAIAAALLLGILSVTGCAAATETVVAAVNGSRITMPEAKLFIYAGQYETERDNDFVITYLYGDADTFWSQAYDENTYATYALQDGISSAIQTHILCDEAKSLGISLDSTDEAKIAGTLADFKEEYANAIAAAGADDALVEQYLRDNALASKVYLSMIADTDTSVDTEEMRRKTYEGITVYQKSYSEDDADKYDYTDEELTAAREAAVEYITEQLEGGAEPADVAEEYAEDKILTVSNIGSATADPSYAAEDGAEITTYKHLAWSLATGEVGSLITENSSGNMIGYVLRCVSDDDEEARKKAEESEIASRQSENFVKKYTELVNRISGFHVNDEALNTIKIKGGLYESTLSSESAAE